MVRLEGLTKYFRVKGQKKKVFENLNIEFPTGSSVALLGKNGAGKSTLLNIIAGTLDHDGGKVVSDGTISWPVGFSGSFHKDLSGYENVKFVARIYGVDTDELVDYVRDFSGIGNNFFLPVGTYSSGMKSRLSFGVSMGIKFDTYLVDEVTSVGDAAFKVKAQEVFASRMSTSSAIFVTLSLGLVKRLCDKAAILHDGNIYMCHDIDEGIEIHLRLNGSDALVDED